MRFKSILSTTLAAVLALSVGACSDHSAKPGKTAEPVQTTAAAETTAAPAAATKAAETTAAAATAATTAAPSAETSQATEVKPSATVRLAAMKGPTAMGLVKYTSDLQADKNESVTFSLKTMPEEVVTGLMKGELDLACVPANLAATLYNKSEGKVQVAAINTLNVLYLAANNLEIKSLDELKGKTIYATGKGATPDATLSTILQKAGLDKDITVEFKSEPTEVAALLAAEDGAVGFLPQPFLTTVTSKNEKVKAVFSAETLWEEYVGAKAGIVTGVLAVRKDFAAQNEAWLKQFLEDYKASIDWVKANPAEAGKLIGDLGIVPAPVAAKALPHIGIDFISGSEMQEKLLHYYEALFAFNPKLLGGALPAEDFYYGVK